MNQNTIMRLLVLAGERCELLLDSKLQNLNVQDVEVDEIWGFVYKKEGHRTAYEQDFAEIGSAYCFVAMERNTETRCSRTTCARQPAALQPHSTS